MFKFIRKLQAHIYGVPFQKREWYNCRCHVLNPYSYIEIFECGKYIPCPKIGGTVVYNINGKRYIYKIVDFKNDNKFSDWLFPSDYINPVIEFVKPLFKKNKLD